MVVQDEATAALKLADSLATEGYEVTIARDMADVLEMLHDMRPDAAVLDLHLRAMGDLSVLQIIKTIHPHIPIVMMADAHQYESALGAVKARVSAYLLKPFDLSHMKALLDDLIGRAKACETQPPQGGSVGFLHCTGVYAQSPGKTR
jgi:DNA-binding NtrC family response regulator